MMTFYPTPGTNTLLITEAVLTYHHALDHEMNTDKEFLI